MGVPIAQDGEFADVFASMARRAVHDACHDKVRARERAQQVLAREQARLGDWYELCPDEFQKPLDMSLKAANKDHLSALLKWSFGEQGLFIWGKTGKCKTRFMFHLLEREYKAGRSVGAWMHGDLRASFTAMAAGDQEGLKRFVDMLVKLDILFIDDLGKGRKTPAAEEAFYMVIDGRLKLCRPCLFTANLSLVQFTQLLSEEYQEPLKRRLRESTTQIEWK